MLNNSRATTADNNDVPFGDSSPSVIVHFAQESTTSSTATVAAAGLQTAVTKATKGKSASSSKRKQTNVPHSSAPAATSPFPFSRTIFGMLSTKQIFVRLLLVICLVSLLSLGASVKEDSLFMFEKTSRNAHDENRAKEGLGNDANRLDNGGESITTDEARNSLVTTAAETNSNANGNHHNKNSNNRRIVPSRAAFEPNMSTLVRISSVSEIASYNFFRLREAGRGGARGGGRWLTAPIHTKVLYTSGFEDKFKHGRQQLFRIERASAIYPPAGGEEEGWAIQGITRDYLQFTFAPGGDDGVLTTQPLSIPQQQHDGYPAAKPAEKVWRFLFVDANADTNTDDLKRSLRFNALPRPPPPSVPSAPPSLLPPPLQRSGGGGGGDFHVFIVSKWEDRTLCHHDDGDNIIQSESLWMCSPLKDSSNNASSVANVARFELYGVTSDGCGPNEVPSPAVEEAVAELKKAKSVHSRHPHLSQYVDTSTSASSRRLTTELMCWGSREEPHERRPFPMLLNQRLAWEKANASSSASASASPASFSSPPRPSSAPFGGSRIPIFGTPSPPPPKEERNRHNPRDKRLVAERVVANWALLPNMQALFLVDHSSTAELVEEVVDALKKESQSSYPPAAEAVVLRDGFEIHRQFDQPTYRGLFKAALDRFPNAPAVMFSNADILYTPSLYRTIEATMAYVEADKRRQFAAFKSKGLDPSKHYKVKGWMIVGQRYDMDLAADWGLLGNPGWEEDMEVRFSQMTRPRNQVSLDYFIVSRGLFDWTAVPPFVVGGVNFDNWITHQGAAMSRAGTAVCVDATNTIFAIHQNHDGTPSASHPKSPYNTALGMQHGGWELGRTSKPLHASELVNPEGDIRVFNRWGMLR